MKCPFTDTKYVPALHISSGVYENIEHGISHFLTTPNLVLHFQVLYFPVLHFSSTENRRSAHETLCKCSLVSNDAVNYCGHTQSVRRKQ